VDFTILDAMSSPHIWAGWFRNPETWRPWMAFLSVLFGLPLSEDQLDLFRQCTGRAEAPEGGFREAWLVIGRRGGKSRILALIACYLAIFRDWSPFLAPGEVGTIKIIATDRRQARVIHRYCRSFLRVPAIAEQFLAKDTDEEIILSNGITIEIQAASFRSVRGYTVIAALLDELAFWRSDEFSANPDSEVIAAIKPTQATIPNAYFLAASSPYARRGELWNAFRRWHGNDTAGPLVWHAATRTMNPTVPQATIDEALAEDPAKGAAEYLAEFRSDVETYADREVIEDCVLRGVREIPPVRGTQYYGFIDPSGGSGKDSMTLAIATRSREDGLVTVVCVREARPRFNPEMVLEEFTGCLRAYRVSHVQGDNVGGEWCRQGFRDAGISYEISKKSRSELYLEMLPLLNSDRLRFIDNPRIVSQFCGLERRTARSGRDTVNHVVNGHDDLTNSIAGVACMAAGQRGTLDGLITDEVLAIARRSTRSGAGQLPGAIPWLFQGR
jgi:hypothetical protein